MMIRGYLRPEMRCDETNDHSEREIRNICRRSPNDIPLLYRTQ